MCDYKGKKNEKCQHTFTQNMKATKHVKYVGEKFNAEDSLDTHTKEHKNDKTMCSRCPMAKEHCICEWLDKAELE